MILNILQMILGWSIPNRWYWADQFQADDTGLGWADLFYSILFYSILFYSILLYLKSMFMPSMCLHYRLASSNVYLAHPVNCDLWSNNVPINPMFSLHLPQNSRSPFSFTLPVLIAVNTLKCTATCKSWPWVPVSRLVGVRWSVAWRHLDGGAMRTVLH